MLKRLHNRDMHIISLSITGILFAATFTVADQHVVKFGVGAACSLLVSAGFCLVWINHFPL